MAAFVRFMAIINYARLFSDTSTVSSWAVKRQIVDTVAPWKAGPLLWRSKGGKSPKHTLAYVTKGGAGCWSGKIQAWVGPCFTGVTFWSDSPPLCHLIPLEGDQNEMERETGKSGRKKAEKRDLKKERTGDKERERGRGGLIHSNEE